MFFTVATQAPRNSLWIAGGLSAECVDVVAASTNGDEQRSVSRRASTIRMRRVTAIPYAKAPMK